MEYQNETTKIKSYSHKITKNEYLNTHTQITCYKDKNIIYTGFTYNKRTNKLYHLQINLNKLYLDPKHVHKHSK